MALKIEGLQPGAQNLAQIRRAALEAKLSLAIKRAERQYLKSEKTVPPKNLGSVHLGNKLDIKA